MGMLAQCDEHSPRSCEHTRSSSAVWTQNTVICNHKHINKIWIPSNQALTEHFLSAIWSQYTADLTTESLGHTGSDLHTLMSGVQWAWLPFFLLFYCHFSLQLCRACLHVLLATCAFVCLVCSPIQISLSGTLWSIMALLWASGWSSVYKWGNCHLWYSLMGVYVSVLYVLMHLADMLLSMCVEGCVGVCVFYESDGNWLIPSCMSLGNAGNYPAFQSA